MHHWVSMKYLPIMMTHITTSPQDITTTHHWVCMKYLPIIMTHHNITMTHHNNSSLGKYDISTHHNSTSQLHNDTMLHKDTYATQRHNNLHHTTIFHAKWEHGMSHTTQQSYKKLFPHIISQNHHPEPQRCP